jgi:anthranilate synthase component I
LSDSSSLSVIQADYNSDLSAIQANNPERYPALLESVARGSHGRYDILLAFPQQSLSLTAEELSNTSFLDTFDQCWNSEFKAITSDFPFSGGWFLYLGYELAAQVEPSLLAQTQALLAQSENDFPVAFALRIPTAIIRDHDKKQLWLISEAGFDHYLPLLKADLQSKPYLSAAIECCLIEDHAERYLSDVERIKQWILDGDVFQVNHSRNWQGNLAPKVSAADVYSCLRQANPAPFSCLVYHQKQAIISSSPERLVRCQQGTVETRPIAGTRPRHSQTDDDQVKKALLMHPKEQAEHIMLVDLERNDLGRVCEAGSVEVDELMVLETYQHVHHIVSNIRGRLRADVSPGQVLKAVFPGGTITGCPKVRCMEIIAELEQVPRGVYTGSVGYVNHDGSMDFNILIRTFSYRVGHLEFRAGAGIVADSVAHNELEETRAKAKGLMKAVTTG